jgi:hypothetical protein
LTRSTTDRVNVGSTRCHASSRVHPIGFSLTVPPRELPRRHADSAASTFNPKVAGSRPARPIESARKSLFATPSGVERPSSIAERTEVVAQRPARDRVAYGLAGRDGVAPVQSGPDPGVDDLALSCCAVSKCSVVVNVVAPPVAPQTVASIVCVPRAFASTAAKAEVTQPCAVGYSGYGLAASAE